VPVPNGFTGIFYRSCCEIIKQDVMASFQCLYNLIVGPLPKLNGALPTLLPKSEMAKRPSEFRPISLIHSFAKLVSKVLALRLAPHIDGLVSNAQSAFIKHRCIHDNYLYVHSLARAYHCKKPYSVDETRHLQGFRLRVMGVHGRTDATQRISIKMEELALLAIFIFLFLGSTEWGSWALDQASAQATAR
jgi:hypothetical protein